MPTFLLEDGTGIEDATSYVSVVFSEDYLGASWAADETAKQVALMVASEYIDARFGRRIQSRPLVTTQGLEFPRYALYDRYGNKVEGIPNDLKKAVCLYAQESVAGTLYPNPSSTSSKEVKKEKTVVGPITTEVEYLGINSQASWLKFPLADKFMAQFLYSQSGVIRH